MLIKYLLILFTVPPAPAGVTERRATKTVTAASGEVGGLREIIIKLRLFCLLAFRKEKVRLQMNRTHRLTTVMGKEIYLF